MHRKEAFRRCSGQLYQYQLIFDDIMKNIDIANLGDVKLYTSCPISVQLLEGLLGKHHRRTRNTT